MRCATRKEKNVRMRAYGEALSVHLTVAFTTLASVWTRNLVEKKKNMADECARPQKMRTLATVETIFARSWIPGAKMNMNLSLSVFTIFPTTFGLAILLVATLASVETFSKC